MVMTALTLYVAAAAWCVCIISNLPDFGMDYWSGFRVWMEWVSGLLTGIVMVYCVFNASSPHLCKAAAVATLSWLNSLDSIAVYLLSLEGPWNQSNEQLLAKIEIFDLVTYDLCTVVVVLLVLDRIEALEASMLQILRIPCLRPLAAVTLLALISYHVIQNVVKVSHTGPLFHLLVVTLLLTALFLWISATAFLRPLRILWGAEAVLSGSAREEVHRLTRCVRRQFVGLLMTLGVMCVQYYLWFMDADIYNDAEPIAVVISLLRPLRQVETAMGALLLSGALCATWPEYDIASMDKLQRQNQAASRLAWTPSPDSEWHGKVQELAGRAISLGALLDFYAKLPTVMKYSPGQHTTQDVVRQVIIPMSKEGGCALATVLMDGACTRPQKMVTHGWSNLFRDLVAAVVADAIEDFEFGSVATLLEHNLDGLVCLLRAAGKLDTTYWICAFAVNQHRSICSSIMPHEVDTVTLQSYPTCSCGVEKVGNHCPPFRDDGKSIPCEMNKFSDMMAYLAATDENFEHVIAVDAEFNLFTRAWVVAEIAQGHQMSLPQHLKLPGTRALHAREEELRHLDVREMRASRPEDVKEILASIPDKATFNLHLQSMIFDEDRGLLALWKGRDAAVQLERAGRVARLVTLLGTHDPSTLRAGIEHGMQPSHSLSN